MYTLDAKGRVIRQQKDVIKLTKNELKLLNLLKDGKTHTDQEILEFVYGEGTYYSRSNLAVLIFRLRSNTGLVISRVREYGYILLDEIKDEI